MAGLQSKMNIFLAGGYSGNLKPLWDKMIKLHFAGTASRLYLYDYLFSRREPTKNGTQFPKNDSMDSLNILESYYYVRNNTQFPKLFPFFENFLLDSGAFTFMSDCKTSVNWDSYVREYAAFINKYDIQHFFELDIDSIVGIKEVERLRRLLESLTGKQCIPVWHYSRGKQYFIDMCKNYKYVALGGIVSQDIPRATYEKYFPWFIKTAHDNGAKIHGLGYTSCEGLRKYHFDSVDSTAWLYGNRGGYLYRFNPQKPAFFDKVVTPPGKRLQPQESAKHNFNEWRKLQKYAAKYL
jgi:hypothetical protein